MEEIEWTENQKEVFDLENRKYGKHIVKACPGSGKTTCISERIVRFIKQHNSKQTGLAVLSFTNVAVEEIKEYYEKGTNKKIQYPHYIGTIDSFIKNFIFLPYGKIVMNCRETPKLVGPPYSKWNALNYYEKNFDKLSYNEEGKVIKIDKSIKLEKNHWKKKIELTKKGFANQHDVNIFSLKILKNFPSVTKALINRFPYLIIDEAQDMSETQMEILNTLIKYGLKNAFLVGDSDQAIFEWNYAKPNLFDEKCDEWKENLIELNQTHRCCKEITAYLSKLSNKKIESYKKGFEPKIISYENNQNVIEDFITHCKKQKINEEKIAILYRSNGILNSFLNNKEIKKLNISEIFKNEKSNTNLKQYGKYYYKKIQSYSENIIEGVCYFKNRQFIECFNEFQKAYIKIKYDEFKINTSLIEKIIKKEGLYNHRRNIFNFIEILDIDEDLNQIIEEWIKNHNNKIDFNKKFSLKNFYITPIKIRHEGNKLNKILTWNMLIKNENNYVTKDYFVGTIHSAKGRTFDAVLLLLKENAADKRRYTDLLNDKKYNLKNNEELRVLFVGMSRPKRMLNIVVPHKEKEGWETYFKTQTLDKFLIKTTKD